MRALTVEPGKAGSAELTELDDPRPAKGELLVEGVALGVCATDIEIAGGEYGWAPAGSDRLVLGHESLGEVREAPPGSGFEPGDLVAGIVRRPDPVPCEACAAGEFDMCRNGRYRERGIKELDGYCAELWTVEADYAVKIDPALGATGVLMEPTSVVAKAWEQIDRIGKRAHFEPRRALVTGAGPIGMLAAMLGMQRGLEVHLLDQVTDGPKPKLAAELGAAYHTGAIEDVIKGADPDVVVEATGVGQLVFDAMLHTAPGGIVCLVGVSPVGRNLTVDAGAVNRELVLRNDVVFGSVNANHRHYEQAADALARADRGWLERLITRRVPLDRFHEALERKPDDVKAVIQLRPDRS
jgi:threonine dehydrogenase-like Zn-dependent dehydrogenase